MTQEPRDTPQFYLTAPSPCPYLPGRDERKVFTHLVGRRARLFNDTLTQAGFRRSQTIAYRPSCESCSACVSVRVLVDHFQPSRSMRKTLAANADLFTEFVTPSAESENYALFRDYIDARHSDGGMADMSVMDFAMMVEDSHVETRLVEYRQGPGGPLVACCLTDVLEDGLSMVYSFYDPNVPKRSLGAYMILDHIARAREMGMPHVYLGYWVRGSAKMDYKVKYTPQERLGRNGWELVV